MHATLAELIDDLEELAEKHGEETEVVTPEQYNAVPQYQESLDKVML